MGQPGRGDTRSLAPKSIGCGRAPRELKHLSTSRKREYSLSSGERNGKSLNPICVIGGSRCRSGVVGADMRICRSAAESPSRTLGEGAWKGPLKRVRASYPKVRDLRSDSPSTTRKVSRVGSWADHCPRLNTFGDR